MKNVQQIFTCMNDQFNFFLFFVKSRHSLFTMSVSLTKMLRNGWVLWVEPQKKKLLLINLKFLEMFFSFFFLQKKTYNGSVDVQNKKTTTIFIRLHL